MAPRSLLLTIAACFGLGLGLSPTLSVAHACSCAGTAWWRLELREVSVEGEGDVAAETALWPVEASFTDQFGNSLWIGTDIALERVQ